MVYGSTRFNEVMRSMYGAKDKAYYINDKGQDKYPVFDRNTKQKRRLDHLLVSSR